MAIIGDLIVRARLSTDDVTRGVNRIQGDLQRISREAGRMSSQLRAAQTSSIIAPTAARDATRVATSIREVGLRSRRTGLELGELRESFASMAAQAAGAHPIVGRLTNVLGTFTIGSGIMIGALAGLAALSLAWNKLSEDTRKAREEQEKATDALLDLARAQSFGAGGAVEGQLASEWDRALTLLRERADLLSELERLNEIGREGETVALVTRRGDIQSEILAINRSLAEAQTAINAGERGVRDAYREAAEDAADAAKAAAREAASQAREAKRQMEELQRVSRETATVMSELSVVQPLGLLSIEQAGAPLQALFARAEALRGEIERLGDAMAAIRATGGIVPPEMIRQMQAVVGAAGDAREALDSLVRTVSAGLQSAPVDLTLADSVGLKVPVIPDGPSIARLQEAYDDAVAVLRERYARGVIDQATFEEQGRLAGQAFNTGLLDLLQRLRASGEIDRALKLTAQLKLDVQPPGRDEARAAALEATRAFNENVAAGQEVLSAFGDLADASGDLSDAFAGVLRGLQSLGGGIQRIREGQALSAAGEGTLGSLAQLSGYVSVAAGAVQLFSGILNESAERERARNELLAQNAEAIARRIRDSTGRGFTTPAGVGELQGVIRDMAEAQRQFSNPLARIAVLFKSLEASGLTFRELEAAAQEFGISLRDAQGNLQIGAISQFSEMLRQAATELTRFSDRMADQRTLADARREIFGTTSPADIIADEFRLIGQQAPDLLAALGLGGVNVGAAEEIQAWIRSIFPRIEAGDIPLELLKDLPDGIRTFLDSLLLINRAAGEEIAARDEATRSLREMSTAFTNVGQGFRVYNADLATFNSTRPTTPLPAAPPTIRPADATPWRPGEGTGRLEAAVAALAARPSVQYADHRTITVEVTQQPGEDREALARRLAEMIRTEARFDNLAQGKLTTDPWSPTGGG